MKLQLPSVALMCIDCLSTTRAINVLEHCKRQADFGAVKLLTSLPTDYTHKVEIVPLNTLVAYSIFCLIEMHKHFDTSHVLIVQRDGWILNPNEWSDKWLAYDYVAPLFIQQDKVGSGGFSLRSKAIMEETSRMMGAWDGTQEDADRIQNTKARCYEDGVLSLNMDAKWKIAPLTEGAVFAQGGNKNHDYYIKFPFGFHGDKQEINHETGEVSPVCEHGGEDCSCRDAHIQQLMKMEK